MGFGGSKIVGHSGTSFKHRKAFTKIKKFNELTRYSYETSPELKEFSQRSKSLITKTEVKKKWIIEYFIFGIIIVSSVLLSLYLLSAFDQQVNPYMESGSIATFKEIQTQTQKRLYLEYTDAGFDNLRRNNLDNSQFYFAKALELDVYGKDARIGITEVLQSQCQLHQKFCKEYKENLEYLIAMNYETEFVSQ